MTHRIKSVKPLENFILEVTFVGGIVKRYDVKALFIVFPQFKIFENNLDLYNSVIVDIGGYGIAWNDELDLAADTIWEDGETVREESIKDIREQLAVELINARNKAGLTQKELSIKTGIYQADISKIERGIGNPSIMTLKRLAEGLDMQLSIKIS